MKNETGLDKLWTWAGINHHEWAEVALRNERARELYDAYHNKEYAKRGDKGDTLTINTKILYGGWRGDVSGPTYKFYAKYPFDTSIYDVPESDLLQDNYDYVYEQKKDLLPITSFIYKKQSDDSFGLDEVKIQ